MKKQLLGFLIFLFFVKIYPFEPLKLTFYSIKDIKLNQHFVKGTIVLFASTIGISFMDQFIKKETFKIHSPFSDTFFKTVNNFGEGKYYLPVYFTVYGINQWIKNKKLQEYLDLSLSTYVISGIVTTFLKRLCGRYRPYKTDNNYVYSPLSNNDSFPSGHTMVIFSIFVPLGEVLHMNYLFIPLSFIFSFTRVYKNVHWSSDVFFAGVLTTMVAKYNLKILVNNKKEFIIYKEFKF